MAKKKASTGSTDVRKKAQEMREAQRKADLRTRNIIIGVVALLVVAIVVAIILIVVNRPTAESNAQGLPEQFREGQGILVNTDGVQAASGDADTLDLYFDYTCGGCVSLETAIGEDLYAGAAAGDYQFVMHPVTTHGAAFHVPATAAAIEVAASEPELFEPLHRAMIQYYMDAMTADDGSVVTDLKASTTAVAELAEQVGVPADVIARFDNDAAQSYLLQSTQAWGAREVEGRTNLATPELVYKDVQLSWQGDTAEALYASVLEAMKQVSGN